MSADGNKVISPSKLAHVVLRTARFDHMKRFYCNFLGGHIVHANDYLAFITYDDEHHRIALINMPDTKDKDHESAGLVHIAFTFDTLKDLCTAYKQRKTLGITPGWCVVRPTVFPSPTFSNFR
jgi:catechol-2,3-dioxygenase